MSSTRIRVDITWENNKIFEVTAKEDDNPAQIVVKVEENGHLADLWSALTDVMERYIKALMIRIGKDMSAP